MNLLPVHIVQEYIKDGSSLMISQSANSWVGGGNFLADSC